MEKLRNGVNVSFEEFAKTTYHTANKIVIPLLNIRLDKSEFIKKGKYQPELLHAKLLSVYELNVEKFK